MQPAIHHGIPIQQHEACMNVLLSIKLSDGTFSIFLPCFLSNPNPDSKILCVDIAKHVVSF
jgi:hypothetical protein